MLTRRLAVGAVALAALLASAVPASATAPIRECGDMAHRLAYIITSRVVSCPEARRVVRRWNNTVAQRGGNGRVRGLYCRYRNIGYEAGDIRCTAGRRVVHWQTYS
jgi:opacity protein-like surface antigen